MPDGSPKAIPIPQIFPAQQELIATLQARGVEVWIVSASLEELVRMVISDPKYGVNLPPERVIGVNLMLQKPDKTVTVGAIERREGRCGNDHYLSESRMSWTLTSYPFAPLTWYGGKVSAILEWIDESQRPILVAGDSPNDFYMHECRCGGIRDSGFESTSASPTRHISMPESPVSKRATSTTTPNRAGLKRRRRIWAFPANPRSHPLLKPSSEPP